MINNRLFVEIGKWLLYCLINNLAIQKCPVFSVNRAKDKHWKITNWLNRGNLQPGSKNIISKPLVQWETILLPPLHIKLCLMNQFTKAHLVTKVLKISNEKLKEGIFVELQIRNFMKYEVFRNIMNPTEKMPEIYL